MRYTLSATNNEGFLRILLSLFLLVLFIGCVPSASYRTQKPSTTLVLPIESELKAYYEDNIEGIKCLADYLSPQRYLVGIGYEPISDGAKIVQIFKNSPAERAGLKVNDIITKINMKDVEYPFVINTPSEMEIKRGNDSFTTEIIPSLMKSNNAIEIKITVKKRKDDKYIYEIINTGIELNTIQFKTHYDRSSWIVSKWTTFFWQHNNNSACLKEKFNFENLALQFNYRHRNFVTERYGKGQDEFLVIYSKKTDIIKFAEGDISVQDLLDNSAIFINGSRENLSMQ